MDEGYSFDIDAFTPATLPMSRLASYLEALSELLGCEAGVHFDRVAPGSAQLKHTITETAVVRVRERLREATSDTGDRGARKAYRVLNDMLATDNAAAVYHGPGEVIPFPGRSRTPPVVYPIVKEAGTLDGVVVSVGGKDSSAHVILEEEDGRTTANLQVTRRLARDLAKHLYGPRLRLSGVGRWERGPEGGWALVSFKVESFDPLEVRSLAEAVREIRALVEADPTGGPGYDHMIELRDDSEAAA